MKHLPFLMRVGEPSLGAEVDAIRDVGTSSEPLPAALEADACGYVLSRVTRKTAVKTETTDDK
jgi:hypothetical protein